MPAIPYKPQEGAMFIPIRTPLTRYLLLAEEGGGEGEPAGGGAGGGGAPAPKGELPDDPSALKQVIADLRKEAASYRTKAKELEPAAARLKELEDADKTATEKLTGKVTEAEKRAAEAELRALRLEVAHEKGLEPKHLRYLSGATKEELEANAVQVLEDFGGAERPAGRPQERLRGGGNPTEEAEPDITELVKKIPR